MIDSIYMACPSQQNNSGQLTAVKTNEEHKGNRQVADKIKTVDNHGCNWLPVSVTLTSMPWITALSSGPFERSAGFIFMLF